MRYVAALLAVLFLLAPSTAAVVGAEELSDEAFTARVVELTNQERANAGFAPLRQSVDLDAAAQLYAEVLATGLCFAHTCSPVPDMVARNEQAGYTDWMALGENIAGGQRTPEQVVAEWMASPDHRVNILNPKYTEIGVGVATGNGFYRIYWAQNFGRRASDSAA